MRFRSILLILNRRKWIICGVVVGVVVYNIEATQAIEVVLVRRASQGSGDRCWLSAVALGQLAERNSHASRSRKYTVSIASMSPAR